MVYSILRPESRVVISCADTAARRARSGAGSKASERIMAKKRVSVANLYSPTYKRGGTLKSTRRGA